MRRLLVLMAVLAGATAPNIITTESPTEPTCCSQTTTPTARSTTATRNKYRKGKGKADSPMLNYIFDSYATSNKHFHDMFRAPSFENSLDTDDTALEADTGALVYLDCRVTSLRDKMVAWLKVSDNENLELLTIDLDTHTADSRFRVDLSGDNWRLGISDARTQDTGLYCCQVSTHPPLLRRVKLTVHAPVLKTSDEAFLESGETLSLKCTVAHLDPGDVSPSIHWFRGNTTTPLDEIRSGVYIDTNHLTLTSQLQVAKLTTEDAGNYTCVLQAPLKMTATTRVHVLQGSSLAELQSGVKIASVHTSLLLLTQLVALRIVIASIVSSR